jgi:ribosomal protein S19E (S16A)
MTQKYGKQMLTVMVLGAFLVLGLCSIGLAQVSQELQDAHKMMANGWTMYNQGQDMVIQGKEMNDQVAAQMGFLNQMAQGNKIIQDGRNTITQGATLFAQGDQTFTSNMTNPAVAKQGLKMMSDAFKMAMGGAKMIGEGMRMNNQVAEGAGAIQKFSQGNQVIETGMKTMDQGASLFRQGENIYLNQ